jgi:hypothetical protein
MSVKTGTAQNECKCCQICPPKADLRGRVFPCCVRSRRLVLALGERLLESSGALCFFAPKESFAGNWCDCVDLKALKVQHSHQLVLMGPNLNGRPKRSRQCGTFWVATILTAAT